jgi:hypothetical protein
VVGAHLSRLSSSSSSSPAVDAQALIITIDFTGEGGLRLVSTHWLLHRLRAWSCTSGLERRNTTARQQMDQASFALGPPRRSDIHGFVHDHDGSNFTPGSDQVLLPLIVNRPCSMAVLNYWNEINTRCYTYRTRGGETAICWNVQRSIAQHSTAPALGGITSCAHPRNVACAQRRLGYHTS